MIEAGIVRQVSGGWSPAQRQIRLRFEADKLDQPHDFLIPAEDVQALIILLLQLSGKFGAPDNESRQTLPLPLDALGIGETEDGDLVVQLDIGATTLAFALPPQATRKLGYALIAAGAVSEGKAS